MIATLDEARRVCRNALSGTGAPAGVDDEAALAAVWLESRALPAFASIAAALGRWADDGAAMALADSPSGGGARCFDAAGRSAVFVGSGLLDIAVATAAGTGRASRVRVAEVTDPWFFLPPAAVCAKPDGTMRLLWRRRGGDLLAGALIGPRKTVALLGNWPDAPPSGPFDVSIECGTGDDDLAQGRLSVTLGQAELGARRSKILAEGLKVDDGVWACLSAYAARVLVPSSSVSEGRGAGPAASDNE